MNKKNQPELNEVEVTCKTCNTTFKVQSTKKELSIDTCSNCHPHYSGENNFKRAAGRVEKFNKKYQK